MGEVNGILADYQFLFCSETKILTVLFFAHSKKFPTVYTIIGMLKCIDKIIRMTTVYILKNHKKVL